MRELAMRRRGGDRWIAAASWALTLLVVAAFAALLAELVVRGAGEFRWDYLVDAPRDAGRAGGVGGIVAATAVVVGLSLAGAAPPALAMALFLDGAREATAGRAQRRVARAVQRVLEMVGGVPSIVFGLFGNALFCRAFGWGESLLAGGATLACMLLPLLTTAFDEALRRAPAAERAAAAACALSRAATLRHVVLPHAWPLLLAGSVLAVARALAETAALLFTSGYADRAPTSLLDSARTLSVHAWDLAQNVAGGEARACSAALLLLLMVVAIEALARALLARIAR